MPTYTTTVPNDPRGPSFLIQRTPAFKPLIAIVTSENLVGTYTHFYRGRTMPCEAPDCEACRDGIPYRWHAYMAAYDPKIPLHFIFECTAQSAEAFTTYRAAYETLRGCHFRAHRMNSRANGRIVIQTQAADLTKFNLPQPPELTKCLAILWSLPIPQVQAPTIHPEKKTPHVRPTKTPSTSQPPKDSNHAS